MKILFENIHNDISLFYEFFNEIALYLDRRLQRVKFF